MNPSVSNRFHQSISEHLPTKMCFILKMNFKSQFWSKQDENRKSKKRRRKSSKTGSYNLNDLPEMSMLETIQDWLEKHETDIDKCDCFEPDYVHYACVDVTEF